MFANARRVFFPPALHLFSENRFSLRQNRVFLAVNKYNIFLHLFYFTSYRTATHNSISSRYGYNV